MLLLLRGKWNLNIKKASVKRVYFLMWDSFLLVRNIDLEILKDLYVFVYLNFEKVLWFGCLYACKSALRWAYTGGVHGRTTHYHLNDWTRFIHNPHSRVLRYEHSNLINRRSSGGTRNTKWWFARKWFQLLWLDFRKLWRLYPKIKLHIREHDVTRTRDPNAKCQFSWRN